MTTDKVFTISEAARETGKSIPTIHTYLKAGKLPNAVSVPKGKTRSWQIPLTDLVAAGLLDRVSSPEPVEVSNRLLDDLQSLRERVARLEAENEQLKERVKDSKDFIKLFQYQIETKQTQDNRRRLWWQRSKPRDTRDPFTSEPSWVSDRDS